MPKNKEYTIYNVYHWPCWACRTDNLEVLPKGDSPRPMFMKCWRCGARLWAKNGTPASIASVN